MWLTPLTSRASAFSGFVPTVIAGAADNFCYLCVTEARLERKHARSRMFPTKSLRLPQPFSENMR